MNVVSAEDKKLYIVALHSSPQIHEQNILAVADSNRIESQKIFNAISRKNGRSGFQGFLANLNEAEAEKLKQDPRVKYLMEDREVFLAVQEIPAGIMRTQTLKNRIADIENNGGEMDVDIAVIDSGIDEQHPDLNVYDSVTFLPGYISGDDENGHGTHVAGIAAARDNNEHVVGTAPGARLWNIRVLDELGRGQLSFIIDGLNYAFTHSDEIDVVNLSIQFTGTSDDNCGQTSGDAFHEAVCNLYDAGVVVVAAAGNYARDASTVLPAAYPETITVSAITDNDGIPGGLGPDEIFPDGRILGQDDKFASFFSDYGEIVDIAAPGVRVLSTFPIDIIPDGIFKISGTSMACPHVVGAVGLIIIRDGKPTDAIGVEMVRSALLAAATPQFNPDGSINPDSFTGDVDGFPEPLLNIGNINPYICGDINNDGQTNVLDASIAAQAATGLISLTQKSIARGDVNKSGSVEILDALLMAHYAVGLPTTLNCQL